MSTAGDGADDVKAPLEQIVDPMTEPFRAFVNTQSASGWLLLLATGAAVGIANSVWAPHYFDLLQIDFGFTFAGTAAEMSLQHWVNDALMALFFFLLGLELKRELIVGRLKDLRQASSVLSAASGGMLVPAAVYLLMSPSDVAGGWAIPVATDTAFALALLVLLGNRVPPVARAFLVGLAIVDDLGAIIIIALVYSNDLNMAWLLPTAGCIALLASLNLTGVRAATPYAIAGVALWLMITQLGLHGTLTGVIVALAAPVRPALPRPSFLKRIRLRIDRFEDEHNADTTNIIEQPEQQQLAQQVALDAMRATAPLARWETSMEKPISFLILPLFAFMNAGVAIPWDIFDPSTSNPLGVGILLGLLVGKPAGILLGLWLGRMAGVADMPSGMNWRHALGIGLLGGIGFTMSLFITTLSFAEGSALLEMAKQSVIGTSLLAGIAGYCWLRWCCRSRANA